MGKEWGNNLFHMSSQIAGGFAILASINYDIALTNITKDTDGRIHETKFTVISVYAPTKLKISSQNEFLENILGASEVVRVKRR